MNNILMPIPQQQVQLLKKTLLLKAERKKEEENGSLLNVLTLQYIYFEKIQPCIRTILEQSFQNLVELKINNCDLRTLENFPKLPLLTDLSVAKNSLQGSFEFIVRNHRIQYIDASDNIIADASKFQVLSRLHKVRVYAQRNIFLSKYANSTEIINMRLALYDMGVTLLEQSKEQTAQKKQREQKQEARKNTQKQQADKRTFTQVYNTIFDPERHMSMNSSERRRSNVLSSSLIQRSTRTMNTMRERHSGRHQETILQRFMQRVNPVRRQRQSLSHRNSATLLSNRNESEEPKRPPMLREVRQQIEERRRNRLQRVSPVQESEHEDGEVDQEEDLSDMIQKYLKEIRQIGEIKPLGVLPSSEQAQKEEQEEQEEQQQEQEENGRISGQTILKFLQRMNDSNKKHRK